MVFLLSSWVLVPLAARVTSDVEEICGQPRLFVLEDAALPSLNDAVVDGCVPSDVGFQVLPIGPGHLIDPHWALRDTIVTFAELHNQMLIARSHQDSTGACAASATAQ